MWCAGCTDCTVALLYGTVQQLQFTCCAGPGDVAQVNGNHRFLALGRCSLNEKFGFSFICLFNDVINYRILLFKIGMTSFFTNMEHVPSAHLLLSAKNVAPLPLANPRHHKLCASEITPRRRARGARRVSRGTLIRSILDSAYTVLFKRVFRLCLQGLF